MLQKGCRFSQEEEEEVVPKNKSKFLDSSHRVDQLYHGLLAGSDDYGQLWFGQLLKWFCSCHMYKPLLKGKWSKLSKQDKWMMTVYMPTHSAVDV